MYHMHLESISIGKKKENTAHPALIRAFVPSSFTHVAQSYSSRDHDMNYDVIIVPL